MRSEIGKDQRHGQEDTLESVNSEPVQEDTLESVDSQNFPKVVQEDTLDSVDSQNTPTASSQSLADTPARSQGCSSQRCLLTRISSIPGIPGSGAVLTRLNSKTASQPEESQSASPSW